VDRIQSCSSSEVLKAKQEKIKQVTENHAKLQLRMDEYLSQLMDSYQPELSDDEKAWVAKLEELKQKLQDKGGYESRLKLVTILHKYMYI
jgi:L-lysine 2,3-aminomutase